MDGGMSLYAGLAFRGVSDLSQTLLGGLATQCGFYVHGFVKSGSWSTWFMILTSCIFIISISLHVRLVFPSREENKIVAWKSLPYEHWWPDKAWGNVRRSAAYHAWSPVTDASESQPSTRAHSVPAPRSLTLVSNFCETFSTVNTNGLLRAHTSTSAEMCDQTESKRIVCSWHKAPQM